MTENLLVSALAAFLRGELASFEREDARGAAAGVAVHEGWLPEKHGSEGEDFPFVVVRPLEGSIDRHGAQASVELIIGVYDAASLGYQAAVNIARRCVNSLLRLPAGLLCGRYILQMPVEWKMEEEQPYPAWMVSVQTSWLMKSMEALPADMENF